MDDRILHTHADTVILRKLDMIRTPEQRKIVDEFVEQLLQQQNQANSTQASAPANSSATSSNFPTFHNPSPFSLVRSLTVAAISPKPKVYLDPSFTAIPNFDIIQQSGEAVNCYLDSVEEWKEIQKEKKFIDEKCGMAKIDDQPSSKLSAKLQDDCRFSAGRFKRLLAQHQKTRQRIETVKQQIERGKQAPENEMLFPSAGKTIQKAFKQMLTVYLFSFFR